MKKALNFSLRSNSSKNVVKWIYKRLLDSFGPQGWWPVTPRGKTHPIYSKHWSRRSLTPSQMFEVSIGAILTQNTSWKNVEMALEQLHRSQLLNPFSLGKIRLPLLHRLIRSSGYFRQKAGYILEYSRFINKNWDGKIGRFLRRAGEKVRGELLSLKGIGPETADSILLYGGGHPFFVVDMYTKRLGTRFGLFQENNYREIQNFFMDRMFPDIYNYREYHALIVKLAKEFCQTTPLCQECPLKIRCALGKKSR